MTKHVGCVVVIRGVATLWALSWAAAWAAPSYTPHTSELTGPPSREQLVALIKQRYPQLLTVRAQGTPIVIALFGTNGRIERTDLEIRDEPADTVTATEAQFDRFALKVPLRYVGLERIEWPANAVVVVLGGVDARGEVERVVKQFFPQVLEGGAARSVAIWIVFDHEGRMLASGEERASSHSIRSVLKSRYPGIQISDMTVTPVIGRDGHSIRNDSGQTLQLHCVWLAAGAQLPNVKE